jgi:hypothetical protein
MLPTTSRGEQVARCQLSSIEEHVGGFADAGLSLFHARRYYIPEPEVLCQRLQAVYDFFKDMVDPIKQRPFFNSNHASRFRTEMRYVKKGYLSDPPGVDLYMPLKKLSTGLQVFRCRRGSSALEGYHLHLRLVSHWHT